MVRSDVTEPSDGPRGDGSDAVSASGLAVPLMVRGSGGGRRGGALQPEACPERPEGVEGLGSIRSVPRLDSSGSPNRSG